MEEVIPLKEFRLGLLSEIGGMFLLCHSNWYPRNGAGLYFLFLSAGDLYFNDFFYHSLTPKMMVPIN